MKYPFGLQLYTVRDHLDRDLPATLRQIREAGYEYVETAGFHGRSPEEFMTMLRREGLTPVSMHVPYETLVHQGDQVTRIAQKFGVSWVVVPWLGPELCPDRDAWRTAGARLDEMGVQFRREGLWLCYHNHSHEFVPLSDGSVPFELLLASADPEHLLIELDTCWAALAGADVCELLRRCAGRCPLLHAKDYTRAPGDGMPRLTELGQGEMPWGKILPEAARAGARWYFVEQDESATDSLESARVGARFMRECNERVA
ncbi:MAG TPA: sugar phosphate isomerase/epimerase [Candidatus Hydrogenedentes bacterium]|nr:sugar phosphate isomerase/epimerase [Candidatus Hydrogenedentota bacterium]HOJ68498.1 sugar phosphate isomerase/epimerase [Candidatus Hydrogenedentota bacterium]HOK88808.1 sugar phosphate isomerase/epimerase [Candidatus Hydrogenedentota bacterium]